MARRLDRLAQAEYVQRYGGPDDAPIDVSDFVAPNGGYFLAVDSAGEPLGSGAWRALGDHDAEMKRVFVVAHARGNGIARAIVTRLETEAATAGRRRLLLECGDQQPEALALYKSMGYEAVTPFGTYAGAEGARHLGKMLHP